MITLKDLKEKLLKPNATINIKHFAYSEESLTGDVLVKNLDIKTLGDIEVIDLNINMDVIEVII